MRSAGRGTDWIVLLEVTGGDRSTIDVRRLHGLVAAFGPVAPITLFSPDRYALQMTVRAPDAVSALSTAIARWQRALGRCDLPDWQLVRAEVMTPAELEAELGEVDVAPGGPCAEAWVPALRQEIDPVEEELLRRALFDSVTGLPSRELFLDELRRVLETWPAPPWAHAVMAVRVALPEPAEPDRPATDDVLAEVAHRLANSVRAGDTVARVGPFDFALVLEVRSAADTDRLAGRILDSLHWPPSEGDGYRLAASAGIALSGGGESAEHLLRTARLAAGGAAGRADRSYRPRICDQCARPAGGDPDDSP